MSSKDDVIGDDFSMVDVRVESWWLSQLTVPEGEIIDRSRVATHVLEVNSNFWEGLGLGLEREPKQITFSSNTMKTVSIFIYEDFNSPDN